MSDQESETNLRLTKHSIRHGRDVLSTDLDGNVILVGVAQGRYYALDAVATAVWRRLGSAPTGAALIDGLIRDYRGDPQRIRRDVLALLRGWLDEGLVRVDG